MKYAEETKVSVAKSRAEIEDIISKAGGQYFASAHTPTGAMVQFQIGETKDPTVRRVMFELSLPPLEQFAKRRVRVRLVTATLQQQREAWEQACRTKWRGLVLTIKAKLVSVDAGIETYEEAFLAQIVVPDESGKAVRFGKMATKSIAEVYGVGVPAGLQLGPGQ